MHWWGGGGSKALSKCRIGRIGKGCVRQAGFMIPFEGAAVRASVSGVYT